VSAPGGGGRGTPAARRGLGSGATWALVLVLAVTFIGPLAWMGLTSLKSYGEATSTPPTLWPAEVDVSAYQRLLSLDGQYPVLRWFLNSLLASSLHTVLVLVVASTAAFALARMRFRGRGLVFGVIVSTLFLPAFVFLMPNYLTIDALGWIDSVWALVVPGAAGAFGVFFLRQFFVGLPVELEEAAALDGANQWGVFTRVVLPNARPALATFAVLAFLGNWNDYIWPVYVLFSPERLTLPAGLKLLQGAYVTDYPSIMAGAVVASVPVIVLFVLTQRFIIEGVARSGLKG
jgi:multiple sugar transport system permease protein